LPARLIVSVLSLWHSRHAALEFGAGVVGFAGSAAKPIAVIAANHSAALTHPRRESRPADA
jgi:hypothetical protein